MSSRFRFLLPCLLAFLGSVSLAQTTEYFGLFLQNQRIGVISTIMTPTVSGKRTITTTSFAAQILGDAASMKIVSDTFADSDGKISSQKFKIESQGRVQIVEATFLTDKINVKIFLEGNAQPETKLVEIPKGATILDDASLVTIQNNKLQVGDKKDYYVFDPTLLSLVKNETIFNGKKKIEINGKSIEALWITLKDPRATAEYYVDDAGKLLIAKMMFGMEMRPIKKEEALDMKEIPKVDLATASKLVPDKPISNPRNVTSLQLELTGGLPRLKSTPQQTVIRNPNGTISINIKPNRGSKESSTTINEVAKQKPEWLNKGLNMPVDDPEFIELAKKITAGETNAFLAATKICKWVYQEMTPFAGVAMLRDAKEILKTKQGVCRDYATLAATLLRAAKIPTKLVMGAVYVDDGFYYHAWVEVYTGSDWIPMEPTFGTDFFDATHVTFVEGNSEDVFIVFTFEGIKVKVVGSTVK